MKTKKFSKKLELNKKNIAIIGNEEMDVIKGGITLSLLDTLCGKTCDDTCRDTFCNPATC